MACLSLALFALLPHLFCNFFKLLVYSIYLTGQPPVLFDQSAQEGRHNCFIKLYASENRRNIGSSTFK